jgi:hypothetical protein
MQTLPFPLNPLARLNLCMNWSSRPQRWMGLGRNSIISTKNLSHWGSISIRAYFLVYKGTLTGNDNNNILYYSMYSTSWCCDTISTIHCTYIYIHIIYYIIYNIPFHLLSTSNFSCVWETALASAETAGIPERFIRHCKCESPAIVNPIRSWHWMWHITMVIPMVIWGWHKMIVSTHKEQRFKEQKKWIASTKLGQRWRIHRLAIGKYWKDISGEIWVVFCWYSRKHQRVSPCRPCPWGIHPTITLQVWQIRGAKFISDHALFCSKYNDKHHISRNTCQHLPAQKLQEFLSPTRPVLPFLMGWVPKNHLDPFGGLSYLFSLISTPTLSLIQVLSHL